MRGQSSLMQLDGWNWQRCFSCGLALECMFHGRVVGLNKKRFGGEWRSPEQQRKANAEARDAVLAMFFETAETYHKARIAGTQDLVDPALGSNARTVQWRYEAVCTCQ